MAGQFTHSLLTCVFLQPATCTKPFESPTSQDEAKLKEKLDECTEAVKDFKKYMGLANQQCRTQP